MGYNNSQHTLISMTNGDVYHIIQGQELALFNQVQQGREFFRTRDAHMNKIVYIKIQHISSVVAKESGDDRQATN